MKKYRFVYFVVAIILSVSVVFLPLKSNNYKKVSADTTTTFHYRGFNVSIPKGGIVLSWDNVHDRYNFSLDGQPFLVSEPLGIFAFDMTSSGSFLNFNFLFGQLGYYYSSIYSYVYNSDFTLDTDLSRMSFSTLNDVYSVPNLSGYHYYYYFMNGNSPYHYLPFNDTGIVFALETSGVFNGTVSSYTLQTVYNSGGISQYFPYDYWYEFTFYDTETSYFKFYFPTTDEDSLSNFGRYTTLSTYYFSTDTSNNSAIYSSGYQDGYSAGSTVINEKSYDSGYNIGVQDGYQQGIRAELSELTPFGVIRQGISEFFSINLFGNVSIGTILSLVFGVTLVLILLKVVS